MEEINKMQVRTDLAVEAKDMYVEQQVEEKISGVKVEDKVFNGIKVTYVEIDEQGEKHIQKKKGTYVTIYTEGVIKQDTELQVKTAKVLSMEIERLLKKNGVKKDDVG